MSYALVDYNYNKLPPLEQDINWDDEESQMPHTVASAGVNDKPFIGSAVNVPYDQHFALYLFLCTQFSPKILLFLE